MSKMLTSTEWEGQVHHRSNPQECIILFIFSLLPPPQKRNQVAQKEQTWKRKVLTLAEWKQLVYQKQQLVDLYQSKKQGRSRVAART